MIGTNATVVVRTVDENGELDEYGIPTTSVVERPYAALVAWGSASITAALNYTVSAAAATVYFEGNVAIDGTDAILINGEEYVVQGIAQHWEAPSGFFATDPATVIEVERKEGI